MSPYYRCHYFWLFSDNLSYIEHIFEISRRPDLLTRVIEYRTTVLKISEDDEIDTKLTRIPSAKKYKGETLSPTSREHTIMWPVIILHDLMELIGVLANLQL